MEINLIGEEELEFLEFESERLIDMNVDEIEEENDKKCVIKLVFFIILKKGICKVEFKEDL